MSVVIPTKDRPRALRRALASVLAQDFRDDIEVIVVNDGGQPVDPVVTEFGDLTVRVLTHEVSTGCAAARNTALDVARGRHIALLDDDDAFLPGHLSSAVRELDAGADLVYAVALVTEEGAAPPDDPEDAPARLGHDFDLEFLHVQNYIAVSAVVFRNLPAVRFDPDLRLLEDWDLWLRLAVKHGFRIRHLPRAGAVYHRPRAVPPTPEATATLRRFHDCYVDLCRRWTPPAGTRVPEFRGHLLEVYRMAFARHAAGQPLHTFWYDRVVRLLHGEFVAARETVPPAALARALAA